MSAPTFSKFSSGLHWLIYCYVQRHFIAFLNPTHPLIFFPLIQSVWWLPVRGTHGLVAGIFPRGCILSESWLTAAKAPGTYLPFSEKWLIIPWTHFIESNWPKILQFILKIAATFKFLKNLPDTYFSFKNVCATRAMHYWPMGAILIFLHFYFFTFIFWMKLIRIPHDSTLSFDFTSTLFKKTVIELGFCDQISG